MKLNTIIKKILPKINNSYFYLSLFLLAIVIVYLNYPITEAAGQPTNDPIMENTNNIRHLAQAAHARFKKLETGLVEHDHKSEIKQHSIENHPDPMKSQ